MRCSSSFWRTEAFAELSAFQTTGRTLDAFNKKLVEAGFALLWLHPRSKRPIGDDWSQQPVATLAQLEKSYREDNNVGVRLGKWSKIKGYFLHVVDVDVRDGTDDDARSALERLFPGVDLWKFPRVKSGSGGASRHIYFVTDEAFPSKKLANSGKKFTGPDGKKHWTWEIELFGTGKQVAIPPSIHPDTGRRYVWENEFDMSGLRPTIDADLIAELVYGDEETDEEEADVEPVGISYKEAEEYLKELDLDHWCEDREGWITVGMALHHEFGGSKEAYAVWRDFSKQSRKFNAEDQKYQWKSFDRKKTGRPVTFRSIIEAANEEMRAREWENIPDEFGDDEPGEGNIADEFEDLPPLPGQRKRIKPRPNDPDMSILRQARFDAPDFPLDIFHPFWQREIKIMAENAAAPVDFVAGALLAFSGSVIGNARWVEVREGWREPPILWCQIIGSPSANKSPAMTPFIGIASHLEALWTPAFNEQHRFWQTEKKIADQNRKIWETRANEAIQKGEEPEEMPANCIAPPEPTKRRAYMTDATLEALVRVLAGNDRGFLNFRDEMAGWYYNLARYSQGSDRPAWLEAYGGRPYVVDRVKDGGQPVRVSRFTVGILGGIQPERLLSILDDSDDGLQSRFMPFWPEDAERPFSFGLNKDSYAVTAFERLSELRMRRAHDGSREPVFMPMTKKALRRFGDWVNSRLAAERFAPTKLKSVYGKANGQVARIAINLELLDWAADEFNEDDPRTVSLDAVERAIRFREVYLKPMQKRVYGHGAETDEARLAKNIAEWIVSTGTETFNSSTIRRAGGIPGISGRTNVESLDNALAYLVSTRWLVPENRNEGRKGRPSKDYRVNERVWELLGYEEEK